MHHDYIEEKIESYRNYPGYIFSPRKAHIDIQSWIAVELDVFPYFTLLSYIYTYVYSTAVGRFNYTKFMDNATVEDMPKLINIIKEAKCEFDTVDFLYKVPRLFK